jgi:hypothetical protein
VRQLSVNVAEQHASSDVKPSYPRPCRIAGIRSYIHLLRWQGRRSGRDEVSDKQTVRDLQNFGRNDAMLSKESLLLTSYMFSFRGPDLKIKALKQGLLSLARVPRQGGRDLKTGSMES